MRAEELMKIKEYQREFKSLFNKKLEIDFEFMNECEELSVSKIFDDCIERYNADVVYIHHNKLGNSHPNELNAVKRFSTIVINKKLNVAEAAKLIKRDRSLIYHYAGKR